MCSKQPSRSRRRVGASVDGQGEKPDRVPAAAQSGSGVGAKPRREHPGVGEAGRKRRAGWRLTHTVTELGPHGQPRTEDFRPLRKGRGGSLLGAGADQQPGIREGAPPKARELCRARRQVSRPPEPGPPKTVSSGPRMLKGLPPNPTPVTSEFYVPGLRN